MKHVFFAAFDGEQQAEAALHDLAAHRVDDDPIETRLHRDPRDRFRSAEEPVFETRARQGLVMGAGLGALMGSLLGGVFATSGVLPAGVGGAVAIGAVGGLVLGALGGVLTGAGDPDPNLEALEETIRAGGLVVTVAAASRASELKAERIFRTHGARILTHR